MSVEFNARDVRHMLAGVDERTLFAVAEGERQKYFGNTVHLRGVIEFSNHCTRRCAYCGLRAPNTNQQRYRLEEEPILAHAALAAELGMGTVVLQSGDDPGCDAAMVAKLIDAIKATPTPWGEPLAVTLSLGERDEDDYRLWREHGADRYLLKLETCDPELYALARPGEDFQKRLTCLETLRRLGYETGSGVIVGLPGQSLESLAKDLLFLADLDLDMLAAGPFVPHPETPWANEPQGDVLISLRATAVLRMLDPRANIPATSALDAAVPDTESGRKKGLQTGCNVVMPSLTPQAVRGRFCIYPGKNMRHADATQAAESALEIIRELGLEPGVGPGASPKRRERSPVVGVQHV